MQFKTVNQIGAGFAAVMLYFFLLFLLLDRLFTNLLAEWLYLPKLNACLSESVFSARSAIRSGTEPLRYTTGHGLLENQAPSTL